MAILSMMNNGTSTGESLTSSISGEGIILVFLIGVCILLLIGLVWIVVKLCDLMEEKRKYYRNINMNIKYNEW